MDTKHIPRAAVKDFLVTEAIEDMEIINAPIRQFIEYRDKANDYTPQQLMDALSILADKHESLSQDWQTIVLAYNFLPKNDEKYIRYANHNTLAQIRASAVRIFWRLDDEVTKAALCKGIMANFSFIRLFSSRELFDNVEDWEEYQAEEPCFMQHIEDKIALVHSHILMRFRHRVYNHEHYCPELTPELQNHINLINQRLKELTEEVYANRILMEKHLEETPELFPDPTIESEIYLEIPYESLPKREEELLMALSEESRHYEITDFLPELSDELPELYANFYLNKYGIVPTRAFRHFFEEEHKLTLVDLMKIKPEWFLPYYKIYI